MGYYPQGYPDREPKSSNGLANFLGLMIAVVVVVGLACAALFFLPSSAGTPGFSTSPGPVSAASPSAVLATPTSGPSVQGSAVDNGPASTSSALTDIWTSFSPPDGSFTVMLPVSSVKEEHLSTTINTGTVKINEYFGQLSLTTGYGVLQTVFPASTLSGLDDNTRMQIISSLLLNTFHDKGEVMGPLTLAVIDDYPGISPPAFRTDYTSDTYKNEVLIFIHIDNIYMLMAQHDPKENPTAKIDAFYQSFKLGH